MRFLRPVTISLGLSTPLILATVVDPAVLDACPGYTAQNVSTTESGLTADLVLAGQGCAVFGPDVQNLFLEVVYETENRLHVKITDKDNQRYEVPESVVPRPKAEQVSAENAKIQFNYTENPFSFSVYRVSNNEVLFSTESHPIIFEAQYLRVKTNLPQNPHIYGLGEHTNPFHLPPSNLTLTMWSRDAGGVPEGTNLYGNHPIYFDHRESGATHGVFLLNSNGMDVKLTTVNGTSGLEYNVIGGVLDFYFIAGSEEDPAEVARQYAEIVGLPAEVPYWSFGLHQCRFGYENFVEVAGVISNYSAAGIPLQTMWTDIDYMDRRRIFTVDPQYFPLNRMRDIVSYLHSHDQNYVMMIDPAVAVVNGYSSYEHGKELDVYLKLPDGSPSYGIVWPGVTVFPDWFHPDAQKFWSSEFQAFFSPDNGIDIDGAWIDMNEPSSFCNLPCTDPFQQAKDQGLPPIPNSPVPDPNTPIFVNSTRPQASDFLVDASDDASRGHISDEIPGMPTEPETIFDKRDAGDPPYAINNAAPGGQLSSKTAFVTSVHKNNLTMYDTHNLFGTMMSSATRQAMLDRRPGLRTLVITRSTFAGAGAHVGKWLGDNLSFWDHYRKSIAGILSMATVYQIPMVGVDICGFAESTTENLCARWAMLGAFYPFMRNHNIAGALSQEFYRWASVTQAAKNAIDIRYRLLDYFYTAFHTAHTSGTPVLQPLWFQYPKDPNTFAIDLQFFYGASILISPVTDDNSNTVTAYFPNDTFYDFLTLEPFQGQGQTVTFDNVPFTQIPVHIRGGVVLPLRVESAMTTNAVRKKDFEFVVAPGSNGDASGSLYLDDGVSITPPSSTSVNLTYTASKQTLEVTGDFGFEAGVGVKRVRFLNVGAKPANASVDGNNANFEYDEAKKVLDVDVGLAFERGFNVSYI